MRKLFSICLVFAIFMLMSIPAFSAVDSESYNMETTFVFDGATGDNDVNVGVTSLAYNDYVPAATDKPFTHGKSLNAHIASKNAVIRSKQNAENIEYFMRAETGKIPLAVSPYSNRPDIGVRYRH